jgi:hypothetical protein
MSNGETQQHFLTKHDEQSLAEEVATPIKGARPDILEVHEDSMAIVQGTLSEMRKPALVAGVVLGASVLLLFGIGYLSRRFSKME